MVTKHSAASALYTLSWITGEEDTPLQPCREKYTTSTQLLSSCKPLIFLRWKTMFRLCPSVRSASFLNQPGLTTVGFATRKASASLLVTWVGYGERLKVTRHGKISLSFYLLLTQNLSPTGAFWKWTTTVVSLSMSHQASNSPEFAAHTIRSKMS